MALQALVSAAPAPLPFHTSLYLRNVYGRQRKTPEMAEGGGEHLASRANERHFWGGGSFSNVGKYVFPRPAASAVFVIHSMGFL